MDLAQHLWKPLWTAKRMNQQKSQSLRDILSQDVKKTDGEVNFRLEVASKLDGWNGDLDSTEGLKASSRFWRLTVGHELQFWLISVLLRYHYQRTH